MEISTWMSVDWMHLPSLSLSLSMLRKSDGAVNTIEKYHHVKWSSVMRLLDSIVAGAV